MRFYWNWFIWIYLEKIEGFKKNRQAAREFKIILPNVENNGAMKFY